MELGKVEEMVVAKVSTFFRFEKFWQGFAGQIWLGAV